MVREIGIQSFFCPFTIMKIKMKLLILVFGFAMHAQGGVTVLCDFDNDGVCDGTDINLLMNELVDGTNDPLYDLNADGVIDEADRDAWLSEAATENGFAQPYLLGDANLDGSVNAADLNAVGLNWQTGTNDWTQGNFSGSGVNAADLNAVGLNWQRSIAAARVVAPSVAEPAALASRAPGSPLLEDSEPSPSVGLDVSWEPAPRTGAARDSIIIKLVWAGGVLQEADELDNSWKDVPEAVSPFLLEIASSRKFFRLRPE